MSAGSKSFQPPAFQLKAQQGGVIQKHGARNDEMAWAVLNPLSAYRIKKAADRAFALADASGLEGARDGRKDAFRHCIWNALATQSAGATATRDFTTLHEQGTNPASYANSPDYDPIAIQMDLHNNRVGRQIGYSNSSATEEQIVALVNQAIANGDLRMIKRDNRGNYLDANGDLTTDRTKFVLVPTNHPTQRAGDPVYLNRYVY